MPDDPGLLAELGVKVQPAFAGLAGGVVGAWADGKAGLISWISYIGAGGITANFLAEPAMGVIPFKVSEGTSGFIVGLSALAIVRILVGLINKWNPSLLGKANDGGAR